MINIALGNPSFRPKFDHETIQQCSNRRITAAVATIADSLVAVVSIVLGYYYETRDSMAKPAFFAFAGFSFYPAISGISDVARNIVGCTNDDRTLVCNCNLQ